MKVMKKIVVLCLVVALCFSLAVPAFATSTEDARGFINYLYQGLFGRSADETGIATYSYQLISEGKGGAWVAEQLYASSEFTNRVKNYTNSQFIECLLSALYPGHSDSDNLYYANLMTSNSYTRAKVFSTMVASAQFQLLCNNYNVMMGTSASGESGAVSTTGAEQFIQHLYGGADGTSGMLGRTAEATAVATYSYNLVTERKSGNSIAESIAASYEFRTLDLNRTGTEYVEALLSALYLDHTSDENTYYENMLTKGYTRTQVLSAMLNSTKFQTLCNTYGVLMGTASGNTYSYAQTSADRSGVEEYVTRLYNKLLGRNPDETGFNNYVTKIMNRQMSLAGAAASIASSSEFSQRSLSNEMYVKALYEALLNRSVDSTGYACYISALNSGKSRSWVLSSICSSTEFQTLYGTSGASVGSVTSTSYTVSGSTVNTDAARTYVARLYEVFLGRDASEDIFSENYVDALAQRKYSAAGVAASIASSTEARSISLNLTAEDFIYKCYNALLDRDPDATGLATYKRALASGYSRAWVFTKICASAEFQGRGEFSTMNVVPGYLNASSYNMG